VGFILPDDNAQGYTTTYTEPPMSKGKMMEFLDMCDEDLELYIDTAIDVMQGAIPDEDVMQKLAKIGVFSEHLNLTSADFEGQEKTEDPLVSGEES
jgi:hypothetical protein